jgi:hypothetical protein
VEKEIPFSEERRSKAGRLREVSRRLQDFPLNRALSDAEWVQATEDLTKDDLEHLKNLAAGHRERAEEAARQGEFPEAIEEGTAAVLLWPMSRDWTRETAETLRSAGMNGDVAREFFRSLDRRTGKPATRKVPRWLWQILLLFACVGLGIVGVLTLWPLLQSGTSGSQVQGPRPLETVFDTQGVKTNIQVAQCRLLIFPEATVAELSAWVTFPEHRVDLWEGTVSVLDAQGQALAHRDVTFRSSSQAPLEAGQGVEVFQQFDAWPWFDKVASFQVTTTRILAHEAHPHDRKEWPLTGAETLTAGYNLKVWLQDSQWSERFASKVHTLSLEFENTGLKPFSELQFALVWRDAKGQVLKTIRFRPVSAFRTALPPGARLGWKQETVFDTEVFSWPEGGEPYPILELQKWQ